MGLAELVLLAVGLSMDAFAVSICKGLGMKKIDLKVAAVLGLFFGGFQAGMPVIGWALGSQFMGIIGPIDHWIAFILLAFIGGKMLWEAFTEDENEGDGKDAEKAEKETLAQLEALKTGNFDEEFLFLCKKSLCDGFAEFYDNPAAIEGWYLRQVLAGSALSPKDVSKKIFNMHKKDVQRVANTLILDSVFLLYGTKNSKEEKAL